MTPNNTLELRDDLQCAIDLHHQGNTDAAIAHLNRLIKRFPDSARARGYLGFLYLESDQLPKALKSFRKTVELSPTSERASLGLFFTLRRLGKFDKAFEEMGRFSQFGKPVEYLNILGAAHRVEEPSMA